MADESISTAHWISMKSRHSGLKRFRRVQMVLAGAVICVNCGCAHLAAVRTTQPRIPTTAADNAQLGDATECLVRAAREQPLASLGDDLTAAKLSLSVLEQRPNDSSAQNIYNFSVARALANVERANIQPWRREVSVTVDQTNYLPGSCRSPEPRRLRGRFVIRLHFLRPNESGLCRSRTRQALILNRADPDSSFRESGPGARFAGSLVLYVGHEMVFFFNQKIAPLSCPDQQTRKWATPNISGK